MAIGDKRWIPQVQAGKEGKIPVASLNEVLRQMVEMIYQLEGRRGEIQFRDTLGILSDGKKSMVEMKDDFINTSLSFGGDDRKSFFVARGATKASDGTWLATDLSASILEWASTSGLNYYYNTGLSVGQSFTPVFQGNVGISAGTFVTGSRAVNSAMSIAGGGDLSTDRTFTLVNDSATPGASKVYGTNAGGVRGWQTVTSPGAMIRLSANTVQYASGPFAKIPFNTAVEDNDTIVDTVNNRLVCKTAGIYRVSYQIFAHAPGVTSVDSYVFKGGSILESPSISDYNNGISTYCDLHASGEPIRLAANEYLELFLSNNGAMTLYAANCWLSMQWARA